MDVVGGDGTVHHLKIGRDRGVYGAWGHLYEIDLSQITDAGRYHLQLGSTRSVDFAIGAQLYQPLIPLTLGFYQVQRSGNTNPKDHAPSHLTDATAADGPMKGQHIDVSGGWYDAGDYLKFTLPGGMVTMVLLTTYLDHPELFAGKPNEIPPILSRDENRIGLVHEDVGCEEPDSVLPGWRFKRSRRLRLALARWG